MNDLLVRGARLVPLGDPSTAHPPALSTAPQDVLVRDGVVVEVGSLVETAPHVPRLDAQGRWLVPGLWDQHVHMTQWALRLNRLDTSPARCPEDALGIVVEALRAGRAQTPTGLLTGWGHRSAEWGRQPNVAELDAVTGSTPVVLISGDGHHGWLNTAALIRLGVPFRDGIVEEEEWFDIYSRLDRLPGAHEEGERGIAAAVHAARERGVVGIVDLEFAGTWEQWPQRYAAGIGPWRVRTGVYPGRLEEVLATGRRDGDPVPGTGGLATQGPLKIISDGSLNTRTAWCCEPYADGAGLMHPRGRANVSVGEMTEAVRRAHEHGLRAALHAIGDAAVSAVLDVFEATGARGSIEHAQLLRPEDLPRWSRLPVTASVQPAHLLDDRSVTEQCWPDRTDRTFVLAGLLQHGIGVALGSDAPVSALDPWLAMAGAVHRGPSQDPSWHPEQALTPHQALASSVDGQRVRPGHRGDLVLLDADPLAPGSTSEQAAGLLGMSVAGTVVAGRVSGPLASSVDG